MFSEKDLRGKIMRTRHAFANLSGHLACEICSKPLPKKTPTLSSHAANLLEDSNAVCHI